MFSVPPWRKIRKRPGDSACASSCADHVLSPLLPPSVHHWVPTSELGGVETALAAFLQGSSDVHNLVFTGDISGPAVELWRKAGAEVVQVPGWDGPLGFSWWLNWRKEVRSNFIERLIIWSPTRLGLLLQPLPRTARALVHVGNASPFSLRARLLDRLTRLVLPSPAIPTFMVCSKAAAATHLKCGPMSGARWRVVHNAVRPQFLARPLASCEAGAAWGMVARLDPIKDHDTLIRATALIVRELPDFQLRLVGDGPLRSSLELRIRDLGLEGRVRLLGRRERPWEEASAWMGFIFSTTAVEGFGIAVAEAMALGLPCVLSDLPVMREVAGDAASYFRSGSAEDLARAVLELADDEERRRRLGSEARAIAQARYSPQSFAEAYLAALSGS